MLFESERHEQLDARSWDETVARSAIERIVADAVDSFAIYLWSCIAANADFPTMDAFRERLSARRRRGRALQYRRTNISYPPE